MSNKKNNIDTLMVRFLQEICTEDEKSQFISLLNDESEQEFFQMKEIFDARKRHSLDKFFGAGVL